MEDICPHCGHKHTIEELDRDADPFCIKCGTDMVTPPSLKSRKGKEIPTGNVKKIRRLLGEVREDLVITSVMEHCDVLEAIDKASQRIMEVLPLLDKMEEGPYVTQEMLDSFSLTDEQRNFYKDAFAYFEKTKEPKKEGDRISNAEEAEPFIRVKCPECGETSPYDFDPLGEWIFCPKCGESLNPYKCPGCGIRWDPGWTECPKCGASHEKPKRLSRRLPLQEDFDKRFKQGMIKWEDADEPQWVCNNCSGGPCFFGGEWPHVCACDGKTECN